MSAAVVVRMAEVRAILGGVRDPLRAVWDERATLKDRRLLLAMAGASQVEAARWASMGWCDLRPDVRGNVIGGLRKFRGWAEKVAT